MKTRHRPWLLGALPVAAMAVLGFVAPSSATGLPSGVQRPAVALHVVSARPIAKVDLQKLVNKAYAKFRGLHSGANADYIPELANVPSSLFGVVIATADGRVFAAGDVDYPFSIQSVSKPFTAALVMQQSGADALMKKVGVEPTGFAFNSVEALALESNRPGNPLVNAGAIATVSLVEAASPEQKYADIEHWFSELAAANLAMLPDIYASEASTNVGNHALADLLAKYGRIYADPAETVDVYTRQCSIGVTAKQLAMMGATLANGGTNPATGTRLIDADNVPKLLSLMMMAGFYDESGAWAWEAGVPAKTGVGGGIVAVIPDRLAIVGFSPRLDRFGNSVRAAKAIDFIVDQLDANIFGSGAD